MTNLNEKPFNLNEKDIEWVKNTINNMTLEEKIGQLFCPIGDFYEPETLLKLHVGGVMYQSICAVELREKYIKIQNNAKIPFLLAANTEYGGIGVTTDGTNFAKPMQVAATDNEVHAYRLGYVSCSETAAIGGNWSFAPVIDIDYNFQNPITNVRTYGSNPDTVLSMAKQFIKGAKEAGIATTIKHFPGDGVDDRDQHLHITVNDLSTRAWFKTYGRLYKKLIADGAQTVMVGHIAQPAWAKKINPSLSDKETYLPATLSKELLQGLLREKCKFNGMIVSDATTMLGFANVMPRFQAVPKSIMSGIDMFLFNANLEEDYEFMLNGYKNGLLTEKRLYEALERILGFKASLGLHIKQQQGTLIPDANELSILRNDQFANWANECADQSVTLVKDTNNLLPISPKTHTRVALLSMESEGRAGDSGGCTKEFKDALESVGFIVDEPNDLSILKPNAPKISTIQERYDIIIYCFNLQTISNQTTVRLNWKHFSNCVFPWLEEEIPTLAVSFANPYHLYDAPEFKTFINAYNHNSYTVQAVAKKIVGNSTFKGISPVDAFCGKRECEF